MQVRAERPGLQVHDSSSRRSRRSHLAVRGHPGAWGRGRQGGCGCGRSQGCRSGRGQGRLFRRQLSVGVGGCRGGDERGSVGLFREGGSGEALPGGGVVLSLVAVQLDAAGGRVQAPGEAAGHVQLGVALHVLAHLRQAPERLSAAPVGAGVVQGAGVARHVVREVPRAVEAPHAEHAAALGEPERRLQGGPVGGVLLKQVVQERRAPPLQHGLACLCRALHQFLLSQRALLNRCHRRCLTRLYVARLHWALDRLLLSQHTLLACCRGLTHLTRLYGARGRLLLPRHFLPSAGCLGRLRLGLVCFVDLAGLGCGGLVLSRGQLWSPIPLVGALGLGLGPVAFHLPSPLLLLLVLSSSSSPLHPPLRLHPWLCVLLRRALLHRPYPWWSSTPLLPKERPVGPRGLMLAVRVRGGSGLGTPLIPPTTSSSCVGRR
ncbi:hypothetical protein ACEWY4_016217 [Coilia grayii]|uniref:Uncharacterized protein n=1 Tax=Coilia grayii TaxID=363190 RepID=A0ABD1JJX8_9TELE